jgi:ferredoxin
LAYRITKDCVKCGACSFECPRGAISEGKKTYIIDPKKCMECGACAAIFCPAYAIVKDK